MSNTLKAINEMIELAADHIEYPGAVAGTVVLRKVEELLDMPGMACHRKKVYRHFPMALLRDALHEFILDGENGWKFGRLQETRQLLADQWLVGAIRKRSRKAGEELTLLESLLPTY